MTTEEISLWDRISHVHCPPEWCCFFEVSNGTGSNIKRYADAVAINIWPSRGYTIRGFEVKVSRADLKNERKDPSKAEAVAKFCDEWFLVTPPGLIQDVSIDLPPAWGLLEPAKKGPGLRTVRPCTRTEAAPLSRGFLAAMCRRAAAATAKENAGWTRNTDIQDRIDKAFENGRSQVPHDMIFKIEEIKKLKEICTKFKEGTGIDLGNEQSWRVDVDRISKAYRIGMAVLGDYSNKIQSVIDSVEIMERQCSVLKEIRDKLADIGKEIR